MITEIRGKRWKEKKGLRQTPGCWSYASPPRVQQTKNAQEKGTKKKRTPPDKYASSQGKKRKRATNISKPRGGHHMQHNASLPPLFIFCSFWKRLTTSLGAVIICNATSLCLLAVHMPTVVEIIVPPLPVPAQPVVCLCNNKKQKKCGKKNMCRSSQP